jgi:hypothetical protein
MPDANPYAKFAPGAAPPPTSGADSNLLTDYHDRVEQAADALWKDVTTPLSKVDAATAGVFGGTRGVRTATDALDFVASPAAALMDSGPGRAVEALSGGRINRQTAGNVAMAALPVAGEVVTEAKLAEAARAAGVSIDTLRANMEARAAAAKAGQDVDSAKAKAARRLIVQGKLKSTDALEAAGEHRKTGAGEPRLLDVMETPAQRVVRTSGAKMGEADQTLTAHQRATRADVSGRATQRTEALSPYAEGVETRKAALKKERDDLASTQYREPYAQPIQSDERMFDILNSPAAFNAMADAAATARERALTDPSAAQQFHEITSLRDYFTKKAAYEKAVEDWQDNGGGTYDQPPSQVARDILNNPNASAAAKAKIREQLGFKPSAKPEPPQMPTVSGGTLDRIRISLRDKADTLATAGRRGRAGGVGDRGRALDEYLDGVPHLKEARAAYADYSKRMEQLDFDQNLSTMRPESFKAMLKDLTPEQRQELVHSVSERLASKFGSSGRSAQGTEDILTTGYNAQANLRELLGEDTANDYLRAIDLLGQNVDKANFAASRAGSQTAMIQEDVAKTSAKVGLSMLTGRHHSAVHSVATFLDRNFSGMGEDEARQIAEWATQQKSVRSTLQEIADAAGGDKKAAVKLPPNIRALIPVGAAAQDKNTLPGAPAAENPYAKFAKPDQDKPADKPDASASPDKPAATPPSDPDNPAATPEPASFDRAERVTRVHAGLVQALGLEGFQAEGIIRGLMPESGLEPINEAHPLKPGSRGGFGYAQWTGPRRVAFEKWSADHGLDPASDEANMKYLVYDLQTNHPDILARIKASKTVEEAANAFFEFESGGDPGLEYLRGSHVYGGPNPQRPGGDGAPGGGDSGFSGSVADYVPAIN